jgi:hypothetical protein
MAIPVGHQRGVAMSCLSCASNYQEEFATEMIIHFSGLKNLNEPGVWAFPKLYVCMNCGFSHFTIQEPSWRPLQTALLHRDAQH